MSNRVPLQGHRSGSRLLTVSQTLMIPGSDLRNSTCTHVQHLKQQQPMPPAPCVPEDDILMTGPALLMPMIPRTMMRRALVVKVYFSP